MQQESIFILLNNTDKLHIKRIYENPNGEAVLLIHGSIEDGKIFYSKSLKGFAPFLAQNGYDVYVLDMQGRGESIPKMNRNSKYGQTDVIKTDIPKSIEKIKEIKGTDEIYAAAHSWGGVLILAYMARYEHHIKNVVLFGSKRQLTVRTWEWVKKIAFGWYVLGNVLAEIYGYFPAKRMGIGSDDEPKNHFRQINKWLGKGSKWVDNVDGFDYGKALEEKQLPPLLFLAGKNDTLLGHPQDVTLLMNEVKKSPKEYWLLAKENGYMHDYGHIDMLTHKDAPLDFFGKIVDWMKKN